MTNHDGQQHRNDGKSLDVADPDYAPRERGLKRRDLILDAALEVFADKGYEAASLQEIVARAGGSLATLYRLFGSKEGLFNAVIERRAGSVFGQLEMPESGNEEMAEFLRTLGRRLLDLLLSPEVISLNRLILAESKKNPRIRDIFLAQAPNRMYGYLADRLEGQIKAGKFVDIDPALAAVQFVEMIRGHYYMRGLLGESVDETPAKERDRMVAQAVDVFLYGVVKR